MRSFSVSHSKLEGEGSSITFPQRKITDMGDWLMLTPGTSVEKVVRLFEHAFGTARKLKVPCDASIQLQDDSEKLSAKRRNSIQICWEASAYTSVKSVQI